MTDSVLSDRAWFTPLLNRIADVAGERAAMILGVEKSGQQIYIPEKMAEDHWLARMIGLEPAAKMSVVWGSKHIDIPPALGGDRKRRASTIAQLLDKGYSINRIVQVTGVSRSTVREHSKKRPKDDGQGSLF